MKSVKGIESAHDLPSQFDVRHLVFADRDKVGVVDHDVGGLKERVPQEAVGIQVLVLELFDLLLVGRYALEPTERRHHREQQVQLSVLQHPGLHEHYAFLGAQPVRHTDGRPIAHTACHHQPDYRVVTGHTATDHDTAKR